jgi:hypothetical protein
MTVARARDLITVIDVLEQGLCAMHQGPIPVVRVRDGNRGGIADYFRVVELRCSGIAMCPKDLVHSIAKPGKRASCPPPEVAGILMQHCREDGLSHVVGLECPPVRRRW